MRGQSDFWARRKAGVKAEARQVQDDAEEQELRAQHAAFEEKSDAELLAELELPDPEAMQAGDDFSVFMAKAVRDRIRRKALRTLWRSNPVLANVDMLVDYGEDFTDASMVIENMQTAYQVGNGMLKHVQEMARQAELQDNPPDGEEIEPKVEEEEVLLAEVEGDHAAIAFVDAGETGEDDVLASPSPRRMKFTFEESAA